MIKAIDLKDAPWYIKLCLILGMATLVIPVLGILWFIFLSPFIKDPNDDIL